MKISSRASLGFALMLVFATVILIGSRNVEAEKNKPREYKLNVRESLSEIKLNSSVAGDDVAESVNSLSKFMENRANTAIGPETLRILMTEEQQFRTNNQKGISSTELGDLIADTVLERISQWSEKDIAEAVESWRSNFNHPDLPDSYKRGRERARLRANDAGVVKVKELSTYLTNFVQNPKSIPENYISFMRQTVKTQTEERYEILSEAMPDYFSNSANLSPMDSMLIAYSVIADDNLNGSTENLKKQMKAIEKWSIQKYGKFPSPEGFRAFGENGYLYSSPVNLLLDSEGQNILLTKIEKEAK